MYWSEGLLIIYLSLLSMALLLFVASSIMEREKRAAASGAVLLVLALAALGVLGLLWGLEIGQGWRLLIFLLNVAITVGILALLIPVGRNPSARLGTGYYIVGEPQRVDERDIVFARIRSLRPGEREYELYYREHPEKKDWDDRRRAMGGPVGIPGRIDRHNRLNISMVRALNSFAYIMGRKNTVKPQPEGVPVEIDAGDLTLAVKGLARRLGADLVGVARLNPLWTYSHRGEIFYDNWDEWGREIENSHPYAIVIATEMDREMVMSFPHTPVAIETRENYNQGAYISVQVANFLSHLGYEATANHLAHYEVCCVPVAVDAGLGEMGRNGYLITREFGPRVRLAVVTTNAPLHPDRPVDLGVQHFCAHCKKCSVTCPSNSIPGGAKSTTNGIRRWKLNAESCSAWWARVGTGCGVCMAVCPWGHPNTAVHRVSKFLATRSMVARRILIWADDLFYGNYQGKRYGPGWCDYRKKVT